MSYGVISSSSSTSDPAKLEDATDISESCKIIKFNLIKCLNKHEKPLNKQQIHFLLESYQLLNSLSFLIQNLQQKIEKYEK